jgi:antibiotic biosynthesis monooxygenase (ABM) superfamily enzyme
MLSHKPHTKLSLILLGQPLLIIVGLVNAWITPDVEFWPFMLKWLAFSYIALVPLAIYYFIQLPDGG